MEITCSFYSRRWPTLSQQTLQQQIMMLVA
jgi:hypothetical protein